MDAEAGNVAVAVRWYLAHDPAPLPHLFRVLWPFWFLRGHPDEALVRQRVEQLLPIASSLGRQAQEELLDLEAAVLEKTKADEKRERAGATREACGLEIEE